MKTKLVLMMAVLLAGTPIVSAEVSSRKMNVVGLNAITDEVLLSDENGDIYAIYGIEDWMIYDTALVCIDDNNTADRIDDMIINTVSIK